MGPPANSDMNEPVADDLTLDDLREIDRAARERMRLLGDGDDTRLSRLSPPERILPAMAGQPASGYVFRCQGGCDARVKTRGDWCEQCHAGSQRRAIELALSAAYEAVSPEGSRNWCRRGQPDFEAAMRGQSEARPPRPGLRWLYERLPKNRRDRLSDAIVMQARWGLSLGSIVLIGPIGIGKTPLLSALALGALDAARDGDVDPRSPAFSAIAGIRYVSGLELAKDERRHALGHGEAPLIRMAKRCPILVMDEVGYGEEGEVSAVREIIRARYERSATKPILFGSGMTIDELNRRFGEGTMKCLWARGRVIDLHQAGGA